MGSVGNPSISPSYDRCSQGVSCLYCPRWCYFNFPPPPRDDDSGTPFSPLIIAIIAILGVGFLLLSYYLIVKKYCRRRHDPIEPEVSLVGPSRDFSALTSTGLDESLIKTITVFKYKKGDGLIEGTECAVCLSEFQENESLRLLPRCIHAFHLPCIDTWLRTQSNCPICRVDVNLLPPPPAPRSQTLNAAASLEIQRPDDLIFVVDDHHSEEVVLSVVDDDVRPKPTTAALQNVSTVQDSATPGKDVIKISRSISSCAISSQRQL